jgi:hypothetical protein
MAMWRKKPAMTEAQWLACTDPVPMVEFVREYPRASPRVWRLFLVAYWTWLTDRSDRYGTTEDQVADVRRRIEMAEEWAETGQEPAGVTAHDLETNVILDPNPSRGALDTARSTESWAAHGVYAPGEQQSHLLRDLFGPHPFRRVAANPHWLTSTVVALAQGIYEDRAFDRMPILADALQDAGCDDESVLDHCRGGGIHVRGCWVLDLILSKS